jgi:hypothetical protein
MKEQNQHLPSGSIIDRARKDACRLDFVSFVEAIFNLLFPGRPFFMNGIFAP